MNLNNRHQNRIAALGEPALELIRQKLRALKVLAQEAECRIAVINQVVTEIAATGLLQRSAILGRVIQHRPYAPVPEGNHTGLVIQGCLLMPGGVGILSWDSEDYFELKEVPDGLEAEAWLHFTSFDETETAHRALLSFQIDELMHLMIELFSENANALTR
jgi:hypothetical protein